MGELARNNNPPSRPQRRPQRRPRPQAPSKNRAQLQENLSAYIQLPADVRKYENANEITPEKITHAHLAIATALKAIQARIHRNRQLKQLFRDHQIKLQSPDYYLAIAVKESKLIPIDVSSSDARGYFQIKRSALDDVAEKAGLIIPPELVFSNKAPNTREQKRASVNNAIIGILYWHIMRDVYPKRVGLNWPEQDKDELAGLGYLMGPTRLHRLLRDLDKPENYDEFAQALAEKIAADPQAEKFFSLNTSGFSTNYNNTCHVPIRQYLLSKRGYYRSLTSLKEERIKINNNSYNSENLLEALRYPQIIANSISAETIEKPDTIPYTVKPGDHLWKIIREQILTRYNLSLKEGHEVSENYIIQVLVNAVNMEGRYGDLEIGDLIELPSREFTTKILEGANIIYQVQPGETYTHIARHLSRLYGLKLNGVQGNKLASFIPEFNKEIRKGRFRTSLKEGALVFLPPASKLLSLF